jgi:hypothetical protein
VSEPKNPAATEPSPMMIVKKRVFTYGLDNLLLG